jgi:hypothetical protein
MLTHNKETDMARVKDTLMAYEQANKLYRAQGREGLSLMSERDIADATWGMLMMMPAKIPAMYRELAAEFVERKSENLAPGLRAVITSQLHAYALIRYEEGQ